MWLLTSDRLQTPEKICLQACLKSIILEGDLNTQVYFNQRSSILGGTWKELWLSYCHDCWFLGGQATYWRFMMAKGKGILRYWTPFRNKSLCYTTNYQVKAYIIVYLLVK